MNPVIASLQRSIAELELVIRDPQSAKGLYNWALKTRYRIEGHLHRLHDHGIR